MKDFQINYTTPEQSKWLLELGVPADSADMKYWGLHSIIDMDVPIFLPPGLPYSKSYMGAHNLPCWSVGRLMEIIDICEIDPKDERYPTTKMIKDETKMDYIDYLVGTVRMMLPRLDFSKLEDFMKRNNGNVC